MELIYLNTKYLNEQLNTFSNGINTTKLLIAEIQRDLIKSGATEAEVNEFRALVKQQLFHIVFEDVRSPQAIGLNEPILAILKRWTSRGVGVDLIDAIYEAEMQLEFSENRAAFSLVHFLEVEKFHQEYNIAIKNLPKLQGWVEQGKEMSGIYGAIRQHKGRIEAYFRKKGTQYDVMARINERGYFLGGAARPAHVAPIADAVLDYTDGLKNSARLESPSAACGIFAHLQAASSPR